MENAVDALKMAFAVIVFVIALSLGIMMFSQARAVSDIVLRSSDITEYYEYEEVTDSDEKRIVGLETIIPTLYKYYKENYTVVFLKSNGDPMTLYNTKTTTSLWSGFENKYYSNDKATTICSFDVDEETKRREPWTGSVNDYKANLKAFLEGSVFTYSSSNELDGVGKYNYNNSYLGTGGFIGKYAGKEFEEMLGEYTYDTNNQKKKRVIVYKQHNF